MTPTPPLKQPQTVAEAQAQVNREFRDLFGARLALQSAYLLQRIHEEHKFVTHTEMLAILKGKMLVSRKHEIAYKMFVRFAELSNGNKA